MCLNKRRHHHHRNGHGEEHELELLQQVELGTATNWIQCLDVEDSVTDLMQPLGLKGRTTSLVLIF